MFDVKRRGVAVVLGVALAVTMVACGDDGETPTSTTIPGDTTSSEPVGS